MDKNNSKLWIAGAGIVAACPSLFCCAIGIGTLTGAGTYELGSTVGETPPAVGAVMICLGLLPWLLPAGVWTYMRRRPDVAPIQQERSSSEQSYSPVSNDPSHDADASGQNMDMPNIDND